MFKRLDERLVLIGEQAGYIYRITENIVNSRFCLYIWDKKCDDYDTRLDAENALECLLLEDLICRRHKRNYAPRKSTRTRT